MDVDEIQRQVSKFQRVSSNGSTTTTDTTQKVATNFDLQNTVDDGNGGGGGGGRGIDVVVGGGGGGVARLYGWPASRIVRVSRASGGKDRHSKVLTSKGLRDRRVRLSVSTAIQFYDLQDRLGYDQPSKAVEWLLKAASSSIDELPSLDPSFSGVISDNHNNYLNHQAEERKLVKSIDFEDPNSTNDISKSPVGSSTSETSKGSGLSLSRSENRIKARERARELASKKDKEKEIVLNPVINIAENSSFTDLLTCGINTTNSNTSTPVRRSNPMDYFFARPQSYPNQYIQIPQFNITTVDHNHNHNNNNNNNNNNNHHHHNNQQHQFSFLQDNFATNTSGGGGGGEGESYNLNFSMTSSSGGGGVTAAAAALAPGFSRGTLQSNLPSSILPHHQRFQSSSIDGSNATNLPFFIVPNNVSDYFPGGYHLSYGNGGENNHKEKTKN